jgi:hypothetical protein
VSTHLKHLPGDMKLWPPDLRQQWQDAMAKSNLAHQMLREARMMQDSAEFRFRLRLDPAFKKSVQDWHARVMLIPPMNPVKKAKEA